MPMMIEHIDAIARKKQRNVLFLVFIDPDIQKDPDSFLMFPPEINWRDMPIRQKIIDWLDAHQIEWSPCMHFASVNMMMGYRGQIYIDIPYDTELPIYQAFSNFLEFPDGTIRFSEVLYMVLLLETAMENAEHDEPGFWERWADNF